MAEELTPDISGPELSAAFQLGFFTRHFEQDVLVEALDVLRTRIAPSMLRRLKQAVQAAVQSPDSSGDWSESLVAVADRALASTDPCRALYDLGAVVGDYHLSRLKAVNTPDAGPVWECVRRMPDFLTQLAGCLHDLAEEANGARDLEAVMDRVNEPWAELLGTDDDDEYRANYRRLLSAAPPWVQRALTAHGHSSVIAFVWELNRELAEAPGACKTFGQRSPAELTDRKREGSSPPEEAFIPTKRQAAILKALENRALTKQKLAAEVCSGEGSRLYKPGGIKELMQRSMVKNKSGLGYYRPDAPPPAP